MKNLQNHIVFGTAAIILAISLFSCSKSRIGGSKTENEVSVYANPETITFSPEHYAMMYKKTYLRLAYEFPNMSKYDAIKSAGSSEEARDLYETYIKEMVDSGALKDSILAFYIQILGVGNYDTDAAGIQSRQAANIGMCTFELNKSINNLVLAKTTYTDDCDETPQTYAGGFPVSKQAGFITTKDYLEKDANQFMFKVVRNVMAVVIAKVSPLTGVFGWEATQINPKYTQDFNNSLLVCEGCHQYLAPSRGMFHEYLGATKTYTANNPQGTNQYGEEGNGILEPLNSNGNPMSTTQAAQLYKLSEGGPTFTNPQEWGQAMVKTPAFAEAQTEYFLAYILGLASDLGPGVPPKVPNNFVHNEAATLFKEKWVTKFKDLDMKPKAFVKEFMISPEFVVTGYQEPAAAPAEGGN